MQIKDEFSHSLADLCKKRKIQDKQDLNFKEYHACNGGGTYKISKTVNLPEKSAGARAKGRPGSLNDSRDINWMEPAQHVNIVEEPVKAQKGLIRR